MTDESKITDEHRATIGVKAEGAPVTVEASEVERLRSVLGESDPRWAEGTDVAPPYVLAVLSGAAPAAKMPRVLPGGILTQQEWSIERPLKIGESLKPVSQVIDVRDRMGGRYGYSVLVMTGTDFFDDAGEKVASILQTITQFDAGARK